MVHQCEFGLELRDIDRTCWATAEAAGGGGFAATIATMREGVGNGDVADRSAACFDEEDAAGVVDIEVTPPPLMVTLAVIIGSDFAKVRVWLQPRLKSMVEPGWALARKMASRSEPEPKKLAGSAVAVTVQVVTEASSGRFVQVGRNLRA